MHAENRLFPKFHTLFAYNKWSDLKNFWHVDGDYRYPSTCEKFKLTRENAIIDGLDC